MFHDFRYALRSLRHSPGFVAAALVAIALGIGANTAIFSVVNTVLLRPLAYPDPDRMVQLAIRNPDGTGITLSPAEFTMFSAHKGVFDDLAAYDFGGPGVNLTDGDRPEQVKAIHVSANYFRLFGAVPAIGRTFSDEEDRPGAGRWVVISDGLWRRRFGGRTDLAGKTISVGNEPYRVLGVIRPGFAADPPADLWLPLQADPNTRSMAHYLRIAARLKPGVTFAQANAQLKAGEVEFRRAFPLFNANAGFLALPLRDSVVGDARNALLILLGTVGFVLLIACANVANLLLARATGRRQEMAVRIAMGASRGRLIGQLLTESLVLSTGGGALGLMLGYAGMRGLLAINPGNIPRVGVSGAGVTLDWRVLAFTIGLSILTGVLFGLVPALNASRMDLASAMKESASRSGSGRRENRTRSLFVIVEVALALVLLVGAALLIRTFEALRAVQPGFDARNVITLEMSLTGERFQTTAGVSRMVSEAERQVGSVAGVVAVASCWMLPVESAFSSTFVIEGRPLGNDPVHGIALMRPVSKGYFDVFRIPLLSGRGFTDRDTDAAGGVVLISEGMAKKYWPGRNPIGERLSVDKYHPEFAQAPREIIGVAGDVRNFGIDREPDPMLYFPQAQVANGMTAIDARLIPITWAIRTRGEPLAMSAVLQEELRKASGGLPVARIRTMQQVLGKATARSDFNTVLLTIFAATALLLAAIGVYGLMSFSVEQRTREIGLRMALGATPGQVRNTVLMEGMRLAVVGLAVGIVGAIALSRVMTGMVYGVKTSDPVVFFWVSVLLGLVAGIAAYLPSRRATRVDPVEALRCL
jgi:putative ABC transport system permease protein